MRWPVLIVSALLLAFPLATGAAINISVTVGETGTYDCLDDGDECPAPKALFFDATATSCSSGECGAAEDADNSFRELHFVWDFGDSKGEYWPTGARACDDQTVTCTDDYDNPAHHNEDWVQVSGSGDGYCDNNSNIPKVCSEGDWDKNIEIGPVAFHVYEDGDSSPYTVTLTVYDDAGNTGSWEDQIYIDDPDVFFDDELTACVRQGAEAWTGCPADAVQVEAAAYTFQQLINNALTDAAGPPDFSACAAGGCRRVLFQDGDSYSMTAAFTPNPLTGPVQIGTFGSTGVGGATVNRVAVAMGGHQVVGRDFEDVVSHYTVFNFDFDWPSAADSDNGFIYEFLPSVGTCYKDILSFRNSAVDTESYIGALFCDQDGAHPSGLPQDIFVVNDGQVINGKNIDDKRCNFFNGIRVGFAGVAFGNECERDVRQSAENTGFYRSGPQAFSHNTFGTRHVRSDANFDLRGPSGNPDSGATSGGLRYVLIQDNLMHTGLDSHGDGFGGVSTSCACGSPPCNPQRMSDILIQNNRIYNSSMDNSQCTGSKAPWDCCTGFEAGLCSPWGIITVTTARRVTLRNNLIHLAEMARGYTSIFIIDSIQSELLGDCG
jgi:hypothetical protein